MVLKISRLAPLALAVAALGAQADGGNDPSFSFSGFATVGVVSTDTNDAQYVIAGQPHGATKSKASGEVDTKLGVQGTAKLNSMFSGTVQLLSKQDGNGSFTPEVEWAFAKAQILPSLSVRVGRMGSPLFAVSDFRDVGYANLWLRPPQDVYGQVPISHFDGADVIYQMPVGSTTLSAQVFGGKSSAVFEHTDLHFKNQVGFNLTAEFDNGLTLRLGHVQGKLTVDSATLGQLVTALRGTPFASVGDEIDATNKKASFDGIGASYDQNNIVASFEYTKRRTDSYVADTTGWYASLGYRFGKVAPYVIVSQVKQDSSNVDNNIPTGISAGLTTLKLTVDGTLASQALNQKTTGVGVRWDFYRSMALKAQYESVRPDGPGTFTQPAATFGTGRVNVYSVAVDMVF
ncbi:MAG TPA: hypothetical protein VGM81_21980 [Burkholderiaceae bacterium]|jgi:hypothetical protein